MEVYIDTIDDLIDPDPNVFGNDHEVLDNAPFLEGFIVPQSLFDQAKAFNMKPLSIDIMQDHVCRIGALSHITRARSSSGEKYLYGGLLIGYIAITGSILYQQKKLAIAGSFIVDQNYRGQGIGSSLVEQLVTLASDCIAQDNSINFDGLFTRCNYASKPLFEKNGFEFVEQHPDGKNVLIRLV